MHVVLNKRAIQAGLSILLLMVIVAIFFHYRGEMYRALKRLDRLWFVLGLVCFSANYCFRALRIRSLSGNRVSVWPTGLYCAGFHGFLTYMLPLRSGDLSLPLILKTTMGMNIKDGISILYRARLLDLFSLGIWMMIASCFLSGSLPPSLRWKMGIASLVFVMIPLSIPWLSSTEKLKIGKLRRIVEAVNTASHIRKGDLINSLAIWIAIALSLWCVAASIRLNITFGQMILLIAMQLVMQFIPIQGLANAGNHEGSWLLALTLLGHSAESALEFALISHILILLYVLLLGMMAILIRQFINNNKQGQESLYLEKGNPH